MRTTLFLSLSLLILGCGSTSTMSSSDAEAVIRSAAPRFITAFNAGNADVLSSFYADDAVMLVPNQPIARGPAAIRGGYNGFFNAMRPTLSFAADRIVQSCDIAYEYGHYTTTSANGNDQGNYVTVWHRQSNGDWKIVADSNNSSMPMPVMH
jgi:ketosteroid isomerase-like protein